MCERLVFSSSSGKTGDLKNLWKDPFCIAKLLARRKQGSGEFTFIVYSRNIFFHCMFLSVSGVKT
jgi:hypothetical protein